MVWSHVVLNTLAGNMGVDEAPTPVLNLLMRPMSPTISWPMSLALCGAGAGIGGAIVYCASHTLGVSPDGSLGSAKDCAKGE